MANLFNYTGIEMPEIKKVLSENVTKLLDTRQDMSRLNLSKLMGVADGTLGRIKYGSGNPNVETLDAIARFFRFETWQLLVDGFDPKEPPKLSNLSESNVQDDLNDEEGEILRIFRTLEEPERTYLMSQAQTYMRAQEERTKKSNSPTAGAA